MYVPSRLSTAKTGLPLRGGHGFGEPETPSQCCGTDPIGPRTAPPTGPSDRHVDRMAVLAQRGQQVVGVVRPRVLRAGSTSAPAVAGTVCEYPSGVCRVVSAIRSRATCTSSRESMAPALTVACYTVETGKNGWGERVTAVIASGRGHLNPAEAE